MSDGTEKAGDAGNASPKTNGGDEGKVNLSQAELDALINKKFAEAHTKAEAKYSAQYADKITALEEELTALKKSGEKKKTEPQGEDLSALKERLAAMELTAKRDRERAARSTLDAMAAELGAVNSHQVSTLISSNMQVSDDGSISVLNDEGQVRLNANGAPLTVREFVKEFLDNNPHMVKAGGQPGAGSQGAGYSGKGGATEITSPEDIRNLSDEDFKELIKNGVEITGTGGQTMSFKKVQSPFAKG